MSQQDLNDFADWLVANPDKKGTPQYETIAKAFKELDAQINPPNTSFSSAFASGIDAPLENMATTFDLLGFKGTADTLSGLTDAPENYESASNRFMNPEEGDFTVGGFGVGYLPRAATEQSGQVLGSLATRAGGAIVGSAGGPVGTATGALAGPALFEFIQQLGPVALQRAKNNGRDEPSWDDWTAAASTAGVSGLLNSIGVKGGSGASILNRTLREGSTEATQSVVEQTGSSLGTEAGLQIDPKQAVGEGIIGGTSAGGIQVGTNTISGTVSGVKNLGSRVLNPVDNTPTDPEAAADLAERLVEIAEQNGYKLNDIDKMSTKGARETVDKAHVQLAEELKQVSKELKEKLDIKDTDSAATEVNKILAKAAQRQARNKTKNTVGQQELDAVQKLVGNTAEGQRLLRILRQMNELTELHNSGYQGGVSRITDQFMPFGGTAGYDAGAAATERVLRPLITGGAAVQTGGASLVGQAAVAGAGRLIDKMTGRRSKVRRYVEQNIGNKGITVLKKPSLKNKRILEAQKAQEARDAERRRVEQERKDLEAANLEAARQNAAPTPNSPQDVMQRSTGLDRAGVAAAIRAIQKRSKGNRAIQRAIKDYKRTVGKGGRVFALSPLIRQVNQLADSNAEFGNKRIAEPDRNTQNQQAQLDARREQGRRDNQAINRELYNAVDADPNLSDADKAIAKVALDKLNKNLGLYPAEAAQKILDDVNARASSPYIGMTYVKPYVDRVLQQQRED